MKIRSVLSLAADKGSPMLALMHASLVIVLAAAEPALPTVTYLCKSTGTYPPKASE